MSISTVIKARFAASKLASERLYEMAVEEIASGNIRTGLWAKAVAETGGDDSAANARYLKLRVDMMKAESNLADYINTQASDAKRKDAEAHRENQEVESRQRKWRTEADSAELATTNKPSVQVMLMVAVVLPLTFAMLVIVFAPV